MAPAASPKTTRARCLSSLIGLTIVGFSGFSTGCAETSLLVIVAGVFTVPDEIDTLETIVAVDGMEVFNETFSLSAPDSFPQSLTLLPGSHIDADLDVAVIGRLGGPTGDQIAQGSAKTRFSEREQVRVVITLTTLCEGFECQPWEWCSDLGCVGRPCQTPTECDDGDPCNGAELCELGRCGPSGSPPCDDQDPCTTDVCHGETESCDHIPLDADDDGQSPQECGGTDCDDTSALAYLGGTEICDGLDNDCNGTTDDGYECALGDTQSCTTSCGTEGAIPCIEGCIWSTCTPPAEICNLADDDCDGFIDDDAWQVLPLGGQRVSNGPDRSQSADLVAVVPEGSAEADSFGLVWADARYGDTEIFFVALDTQGVPLTDPIRVTDAPGNSDGPSIVWTGSEFVVAWTDSRPGGTEIFAQRLAGQPAFALVGEQMQITDTMGNASEGVIAWNGEVLGLVWIERVIDNLEVQLMAIDVASETIFGSATLSEVGISASEPFIIQMDTAFGVGWIDRTPDGDVITVASVDVAGAFVSLPQPLATLESAQGLSAASADSVAVVTWANYSGTTPGGIAASVLDFEGAVIVDSTMLTSDDDASAPSVVWTGSEVVIAWTQQDTSKEIAIGRYTLDLEPIGSPVAVTSTGGTSENPTLAPASQGVVVAWEDGRDANDEIYSAFVGCGGG